MALGVVDLERAEQLVAEPDRVDHEAPHVRHRSALMRGSAARVADRRPGAPSRSPPAGTAPQLGAARRGSGRPMRAAVGQGHLGAVPPVDPEVAPVEQPVGQPLDLLEGALQRGVARRSPISIRWTLFRSSAPIASSRIRLVSRPSTPSASRHRHPADRRERCSAATTTTAGDERQQVGDDLPAEDQDLLGLLQLVAHQQREVEERPGREEVHARRGWRPPAGNRARAPGCR